MTQARRGTSSSATKSSSEVGAGRSLGRERRDGVRADVVDDARVAVPHQPAHDVRAHPAETDHAELHAPSLYARKHGGRHPPHSAVATASSSGAASCTTRPRRSSREARRDAAATRSRSTRPKGRSSEIEAWLRERGFFAPGGEELVADLYLGYGLSSTIRRGRSPAPPEPCPLPLAACAVRREEYVVERDNDGA